MAGSNKERKREAAKTIGDPIELSSKVIDFVIIDQDAYVAESGWQVRRVSLQSGKTLRLFKGHQGPVTSIAISESGDVLFSGSWDKTIRVWDVKTGALLHVLNGHTDFIKSLRVVGECLISTSSDKTIRVWDLAGVTSGATPVCIQTLREHSRPVDSTAVTTIEGDKGWRTVVWTGDSMGVIHEWELKSKTLEHLRKLQGHETSVTELVPVEDGLWSASMDKSAIFHSQAPNAKRFVIPHDTYVHSILPLPSEVSTRNLVVTGGDDESLRVWEVDDEAISVSALSVVDGHTGPLSSIKLWKADKTDTAPSQWKIVTGSLDGTLRRWTLENLLSPTQLAYAPTSEKLDFDLTEEEERELAELMGDDA